MSALAQFIMKGRNQAILVVSFFTILSWLLSLASLLAAAALALPTLRLGPREGLIVMVGALPAVAVSGYFLMGNALEAAGFALIIWVPVLLVSWVLRLTANLSVAVSSAVGLGSLSVVGFYGFVDDVAGFWKNQFQVILKPILEQQAQLGSDASITMTLDVFSRYATGSVAAGSILSVLMSVLLARWWQAGLYNPGGFRKEFTALRLNRWLATGLVVLTTLILMMGNDVGVFLANLVLPLFVGAMLAGFSLVHAKLSNNPSGRFWLTGLYIGIMFVTPLIILIAFAGIADSWLDWRRRSATGSV